MDTTDSGKESGESYTPVKIQKRFLENCTNSNSKRSLFCEARNVVKSQEISDTESDLGIMSPLALSDQSPSLSSALSTPGRQFVSPLASLENSPNSSASCDWICLKSSSDRHRLRSHSPFQLLKKMTQAARSSPCNLFFPKSPQINITSSNLEIPTTPPRSDDLTEMDEIVPETPQSCDELQNSCIMDTPHRSDSPEYKLITPLGSIRKDPSSIPRLHRRKLLEQFDSSPGKKSLKRNLPDAHSAIGTKLLKSDEISTIPKARAALFQDKEQTQEKEQEKEIMTINTKSFYGTQQRKIHPFKSIPEKSDKQSMPSNNNNTNNSRRSSKKSKFGQINCGVRHGIKKPKLKRLKVEKAQHIKIKKSRLGFKENDENQPTSVSETQYVSDSNKKFFKTSELPKTKNNVTITMNSRIKLNMLNGKVVLSERNNQKNIYKKEKVVAPSYDATDLSVDEPEIESTVEKNKVATLLQILEDDWGTDDYDTMGSLEIKPPPQDIMMSPSSELSNMTSVMNIQDNTVALNTSINTSEASDKSDNSNKFYPLFTKGYNADHSFEESSKKGNKKNPTSWQLSTKTGRADGQYQLDLGQKKFGATQCKECGVMYQIGDPSDENAHLNFHNGYKILKFQGWKTERVVHEDYTGRVILIEPTDPKNVWNKVSDVLAVVDGDLGLADMELNYYRNKKVYMYIRDKMILGVLVAEPIESAHRMIPELIELDCCTAEVIPAKCGINVVWTAMSHRRQHIATKLVDVLRRNFYYGYILTLEDIAFSIPTPSGKIFAEKYTRTRNFKVYN